MKKIFKPLSFVLFSLLLFTNCDTATSPELELSDSQFNNSLDQGTMNPNSEDSDSYQIVNENNLDIDWIWSRETGDTGEFEFTEGPDTPIIGHGSATFRLFSSEDGVTLTGAIFDGSIRLDELEHLEYNTYQTEGTESQSIAIQFNMNYLDDEDNSWQGRLVFEPYYSSTIISGEWQTWNALELSGWWATGAPGNEVCPISDPCTFQEVLEAFPDAEIRSEPDFGNVGLIHFKAGSGWDTFEGSVDGFSVEYIGNSIAVNFTSESLVDSADPQVKDDCKNGGWVEYGFKNQGQCIRYVNTGKDSRLDDRGDGTDDGDNGDGTDDGENGDGTDDGDNGDGTDDGENGDGTDDGENGDGTDDGENGDGTDDGDNGDGTDDGENGDGTDDGDNGDGTDDGDNGDGTDDGENGDGTDDGDNGDGTDDGENGDGTDDGDNGDGSDDDVNSQSNGNAGNNGNGNGAENGNNGNGAANGNGNNGNGNGPNN